MIKRSLLWVLAAYCIGIVFRDRLKWLLWAVLFSCVFLGCIIWNRRYTVCSRRGYERFLLLLLPALLLGAFLARMQAADYPMDAVLTEKTVAFAEGRIRSIAETKSGYQLELNHISIDMAASIEERYSVYTGENASEEEKTDESLCDPVIYTKGKLLVYCDSVEGLKIGNYIRLEGKAVPLSEPENAGQFDERAYYRAERICCKFNADSIEVLNDGVDEIREWCRTLRLRLDSVYEEILPQKHAGIVSAILLGDKAELDADTKALYQKNGIAHILAISGLHVSLLGMGLFAIIRKVGSPLIPAAAATMLMLVFYGCLTEFSVSTQRAIGMLIIAMFAKILGRSYDSRSACAFCGLLILLANPMQLYQAGFQLSFGAAFGISYFGRELELMKLSKGKTVTEKLKISFLSGMTTQLITVPIILNSFYELPVYSVFLNLPVIGLLSSVVFLSILAGFAGIFSYSFGKFLAGGVYVILEFYELLCRGAEKLPCPVWLYGKPQEWRSGAYFSVLALFFIVASCIGRRYRHHPRQYRYRRLAFLVLCLLPLVFIRGGGRIAVSQTAVVDFLSVGQGDCSVIRTKNGSTYLIDCGSTSVRSVGEYRLKPWLKYHGISQLEAVFLSHPDSDHTNGVLELLEKTNEPDDWYRGEIQIKNLVLPAAYREEDGFVAMYELAVDRNIPVFWFDTGDTVAEEDIIFTCLHPIETYSVYDTNDASMVLMVECADTIVFFTGDIGGGGEEQVIGAVQDRVSQKQVFDKEIGHQGQQQTVYAENKMNGEGQVILKVAHHGSRNSTSEAFLNVLQPDIAVISCGKDNSFGHPHEETLERVQKAGCDIVSTPELGTVTVWIGRTGTTVTGYKSGVHR